MNPNAIALAAAVTAAAATDLIRRFKKSNTKTPNAMNPRKLIEDLIEQTEHQGRLIDLLVHQNDYMSTMLDMHDVPVSEFDRIAMIYPNTAEK